MSFHNIIIVKMIFRSIIFLIRYANRNGLIINFKPKPDLYSNHQSCGSILQASHRNNLYMFMIYELDSLPCLIHLTFVSKWEVRSANLGLVHTGSQVLSPKSQLWYEYLHDNTFRRWGLELVLWVGSSKMLDPTLNLSLMNIFA